MSVMDVENSVFALFHYLIVLRASTCCFKDTGFKIPNNAWYEQRLHNPEAERLRVVKAAAPGQKTWRSMQFKVYQEHVYYRLMPPWS